MPPDPVLLDPGWSDSGEAHGPGGPSAEDPHPPVEGPRGWPGPGRDRVVMVVICLIVVVALVTAAITGSSRRQAEGPTAPPSDVHHTSSPAPQHTSASDQSTTAELALPATLKITTGTAPQLPWPTSGQASVAVSGLGVMGRSGGRAPRPIASITKVMTAYVVLADHPLKAGRSGPTITVSAAEAAAYPQQVAGRESLVRVSAGEKLTEYQALQALLIASGDNMAQILARWDAGSIAAFVDRMNATARSLNMPRTRFVDPDGLSSASVSTSTDLLQLAAVALAEPALLEIVGMKRASIPLNTLKNYNTLLGQDGVFGIKTGSTTPAGGCLLFAAERKVGGKTLTIYGAVLGAPGTRATILTNALTETRHLVEAAAPMLKPTVLITAGTPVATMRDAAGQTWTYAVTQDIVVNGWKGLAWHLRLSSTLQPGQAPDQVVIKASTGQLTVPLTRVTDTTSRLTVTP